MTDAERAHRIVEDFRADGHPYYDELLAPIEFALAAARRDERRTIAAWLRERFGGIARQPRMLADLVERGAHDRSPAELLQSAPDAGRNGGETPLPNG